MASNKPTQTDRYTTMCKCETIIEQGKDTFVDVGLALAAIRENEWYQPEYKTFKAYCKGRWGFSDTRGRQLIASAETALQVTSGQEDSDGPQPVVAVSPTDHQARELRKLPEKKRTPAWDAAVKAAGGEQPSMEHVRAAVAKRLPKQEKADTREQFDAQYNAHPPAGPPEEHEPAGEPPESEPDPEPDPKPSPSKKGATSPAGKIIGAVGSIARWADEIGDDAAAAAIHEACGSIKKTARRFT